MKKILLGVLLFLTALYSDATWNQSYKTINGLMYYHGNYMIQTLFSKTSVNLYRLVKDENHECISYISAGYETTYCGAFSVTNRIPIKMK